MLRGERGDGGLCRNGISLSLYNLTDGAAGRPNRVTAGTSATASPLLPDSAR